MPLSVHSCHEQNFFCHGAGLKYISSWQIWHHHRLAFRLRLDIRLPTLRLE